MKGNHIFDILEKSSLSALDDSEQALIEAHATECTECHQALVAARISQSLLRDRAVESFVPSPFFGTRVLALLRERQATREAWGLGRMWRAAGALVSSMAVTVAILAIMSVMLPGRETVLEQETVSAYSADAAMLGTFELSDDQVTDGQVLNTLYEVEDETAR
jgi:hypothetical protein